MLFRSIYDWNDINLNHNFREVDYLPENDRLRYTIDENARQKLLERLLKLNHELYIKQESSVKHNSGASLKSGKSGARRNSGDSRNSGASLKSDKKQPDGKQSQFWSEPQGTILK